MEKVTYVWKIKLSQPWTFDHDSQPTQRVWMGLTDNWQIAKILTDNWQMAENLTDNWYLPWVLLSAEKGPDCPLFSTKPFLRL